MHFSGSAEQFSNEIITKSMHQASGELKIIDNRYSTFEVSRQSTIEANVKIDGPDG